MSLLLDKAIVMAAESHTGQLRKGEINRHRLPYVTHPLDVMKTVWKWGAGDEVTMVAAILHDVLEDTSLTVDCLTETFGREATNIVQEMTREPDVTLDHFHIRLTTGSVSALVIAAADLCCNTLDYLLTDPRKAVVFFQKAHQVVEAIHARLPAISETYGPKTSAAIVSDLESLVRRLQAIDTP